MKRLTISIFFAVPLLLAGCSSLNKNLLTADPQVRSMAIDELNRSDAKKRSKAVYGLKKILARKNSPCRGYAASALEDLGQAAEPAIPELIAALTGGDLVASSAARALSKLEGAAPLLAAALKSRDPALRREAARILPAHGAAAAALLAKNLDSPDTALAVESARILSEIGPAAKDAVPPLARAAFSGGNDLKTIASIALVKIGRPAGTWLSAALKAPDEKIRSGAAQVLSRMFPPPAEATAPLIASLEDRDPIVRAAAARALGNYTPGAMELFPESYISALFRSAQSKDEVERTWASIALIKTGSPAGKWLSEALKDPDPAVRSGAAMVISRMFPPPGETAAAALAALKDTDLSVRRAAAAALETYAMAAPTLLPRSSARELSEAMKDKDPLFRASLIPVLSRLAPGSRQAMSSLISSLKDRSLQVKKQAASALGALGPAAGKALPALKENLKSRDCTLRVISAKALISIDPAFKRNSAAARAAGAVCGER